MSSLDFNDSVDTHFHFKIGGVQYKLKYPNLDELEALRSRILSAEKKGDKEFEKVTGEELNKLISSDSTDAPPIEKVLQKQPVNVVKSFNRKMIEELEVI